MFKTMREEGVCPRGGSTRSESSGARAPGLERDVEKARAGGSQVGGEGPTSQVGTCKAMMRDSCEVQGYMGAVCGQGRHPVRAPLVQGK